MDPQNTEAAINGIPEQVGMTTAQTPPTVTTQASNPFFTAEDLQKAREQEKAKLYPQMEKMKEEMAALKRAAEDKAAEEERRRQEADLAAKKQAEEDMDVRSLLQKKEEEWSHQLQAEREEREKAIALLDRERQFQELQAYRQQRLDAVRDDIIPDLLDLVDGSTPDEIEQSIEGLKNRSARILDSAQQAMQSMRREMAGTRVTAPAAGPLDNDPANAPVTPDDVRNMSLADYAKNRNRLLGNAANGSGRGLFG